MIFVLHRHRSLENFYVSVCVVFEFCLTLTFLVSIYIRLVNRRFWVRDWTYLTSQLVVETSFDQKYQIQIQSLQLCSLQLRCFRQESCKSAWFSDKSIEFSCENVKMVPGDIDIAYTCLIKRSLLENAEKSKTVFAHWFSGDVNKI